MRSKEKGYRLAFTMLELIAVVVMIGLISAVSMISIGGHLDQAKMIRTSQEIARADQKERDAARQSPLLGGLTIDKGKQRLQFIRSGKTIAMGDNLKFNGPLIMPTSSGSRTIAFSQTGQSPTYALQITSKRGASRWVVIVGTTGQAWFSDDSDQVRSLMTMGR
jgi:type II secretory pathway pseudopilin PulG